MNNKTKNCATNPTMRAIHFVLHILEPLKYSLRPKICYWLFPSSYLVKEGIFTEQVINRLEDAGTRVYPVEMYAVNKGFAQNKIMLGYRNLNEVEIIEGIKRMKSVI
ncbi:MAG: hypothetical protein PHG06_20470 [Parabacteroides sp.]|nr:hypothetical protein [Parabacteroides sp.]